MSLYSTAPPSPEEVTVILLTPVVLKVTWSRPSSIRGELVFFTVYATPLVSQSPTESREKRQAVNNSLGTITKVNMYSFTSYSLCLSSLKDS